MKIKDLIEELNWMSSNIGEDSNVEVIKQDGLCIFRDLDNSNFSVIFIE